MKCSVRTEALEVLEACIGAIAEETRLHFTEDGLRACMIDRGNAAMVDAELVAAAFEELPDAPQTFGVNLGRFRDNLGMCGDVVDLELGDDHRLHFRSEDFHGKLALIDPDSIRQEPDMPDISDHAVADVQLEAVEHFTKALKSADLVSDHVRFITDPDADHDEAPIVAVARGDVDETRYGFGADKIRSGDVDAEGEALYSLEYLKPMARPLSSDMALSVTLTDNAPMEFGGVIQADDETVGKVTNVLAPRIE